MNRFIKAKLTAFVILISVISFTSCEESTLPSKEQEFLKKLQAEWKVNSVVLDDVNVSALFSDLLLSINEDGTFQCNSKFNGIWNTSGKFELIENTNTSSTGIFDLQREDGILIHVSYLDDERFTIEFNYTSPQGRVKSISGSYTFDFVLMP